MKGIPSALVFSNPTSDQVRLTISSIRSQSELQMEHAALK